MRGGSCDSRRRGRKVAWDGSCDSFLAQDDKRVTLAQDDKSRKTRAQDDKRDAGMSMVEIVISLFLMGILSLAVLPLIIGVTQHSVVNKNTLAGTNFARSELTSIQAAFPSDPGTSTTSCNALQARQNSAGITDTGTGLTAFITVGSCPTSGYPRTVPVTITVKKDSDTVATLKSRVRVAKAGA
ncbi:type IV pilus modification PilV family protein [Leucobacter sp. HY1910]